MHEYLSISHSSTTNRTSNRTSNRRTAQRSGRLVASSRWRDAGLLAASLGLVAVVAIIGRGWTDTSGSWYDQLDKPAWTSPGAAFGIVWTVLYFMMAVAAWLIVRKGLADAAVRTAMVAYLVQLALNLGWTAVFFAGERPGWAIVEISFLLVAVAVTIWCFAPLSRVAAWLLVPYLLWVIYATTLTVGIAVLNR